ncbi:hypothetical protein [Phaeobacter sp. JH72H1]|jgi:hypothetical protein|uniref:hypothetical protein n=1 Tax=Phaeobacter sp. JH72H1 TaxID=1454816 RepID=UPI003A8A7D63
MAQIVEKTGDPASRHRHSDIVKFPVRIGAFLVLLSLSAHLFLDERTSVALASITLALIGGAYNGFGAADGNPRVFWAELAVALLFALAAFLGLIWHWAFLLWDWPCTPYGTSCTTSLAVSPAFRTGFRFAFPSTFSQRPFSSCFMACFEP